MGLAGCSSVTNQEFVAGEVRLPAAVSEELGLPESFTDTRTRTLEQTVADQEIEVTISTQFAGYQRAPRVASEGWWSPDETTLVERFVGTGRAATPGSGSAINAIASELEFGQSNPAYVDGDATVDPNEVTVIVPERARHDGEVRLEELLTLHHADALGVDELTSRGANNYLVDARDVIPPKSFHPDTSWSSWTPDDRWVAGHDSHWIPDEPSSLRCLVCLGEQSPADVFDVEEMPGRRLEEGESVETAATLVLIPAPKEYPGDVAVPEWRSVFDAGIPSMVRGATYGLGVMATPNAEIEGESVNPLAQIGLQELLTSDVARDFLRRVGVTDADEVEWIRGPNKTGGAVWGVDDTVSILDEETAVESFAGVVSGRAGPWAVAIHAAKATPDDVVFAAATHRRPIGTPDGRELASAEGGFIDQRWAVRALDLTAIAFGSLTAAEEG